MKRIFFGQNDLRFLFYRFKDSRYYSLTLVSFTIIVSMILVFSVVIPLASNYFSIRNEVLALRTKIGIIQQNTVFMANLNKDELDSQVKVASQAIPADKDFAQILNALADSSLSSGVSLEDFVFVVGNISSKSAKLDINQNNPLSTLDLELTVKGRQDNIKAFVKEINEKLPLSEINGLESNFKSTKITVKFYHKPFPNIAFKEDEQISPISAADKETLQKLSTWETAVNILDFSATPSTQSANSLFE